MSALPSHRIIVGAGSGQERLNFVQSAKPALLKSNFYSGFKSFPLFLPWAGLAELENIGIRHWDPPLPMIILCVRDWDPPVRLFIWCEFADYWSS